MKIAVAMSGGIDSSLTAILLKEQGHEIVGLTARVLPDEVLKGTEQNDELCCSTRNIIDARRVADEHGFPHHVLDLQDDFSRGVIHPFCEDYFSGRTPSPCLNCNVRIKFGRLLEEARKLGCETIATGHYARIITDEDGRSRVSMGADRDKDQAYFLAMLPREILGFILLPLGGFRKEEIRAMAAERELFFADKPESQEICFVIDGNYPAFIERYTGKTPGPGDIIDTSGNVLGTHNGIHRYTIGQRRGMGIAAPHPLYVLEIDAARNVVIAGRKEELLRTGLFADRINYMKADRLEGEVLVKTRSTQPPVPGILKESDGGVYVYFNEPQSGISPGQAAVFYNEARDILGGAWIVKA
ncbi:MAG TPA: tRNA 2-thiouridine(34) synthase MnmA, partial [Spirochaetota bacterium]|nr:tRNA 2-thiouridine(34) synthase MnmA [Spirochaetota bacterium]